MAHAFVTLCAGADFASLARLTHPLMRRYAERFGLEFVVLEGSTPSPLPVHYEKFRIAELLGTFDRVLYVDTDVLIHPSAPDLLSAVPRERFGAYTASRHSDVHDDSIREIQNRLGAIGWSREYFNSGVMAVSRDHADAFDLRHGTVVSFWEQTQLNYNVQLLRFPLFDITYRFNHVKAAGYSENRSDSHFIHYAGPGHHDAGEDSTFPPRITQIALDLVQFANNRDGWNLPPTVMNAVRELVDEADVPDSDRLE